MKRKMIAVGAVLAVLLAGSYAVQAGPMGGAGCRNHQQAADGHGCRPRMEGHGLGGRLEKMAIVLGLSDSQRQEIEAIMQAQHESNAPLREQIAAGRQQLREAGRGGELDEAKVAALAEEQAKLMSEMMVSHIREKNRIFALLTPEQQEKAELLGDGCGLGPACGGPACGGPACGGPDGGGPACGGPGCGGPGCGGPGCGTPDGPPPQGCRRGAAADAPAAQGAQ